MNGIQAVRAVVAVVAVGVFGLVAGAGARVVGAASAAEADRAFVAKVSQGGLYEVEAGRVAEAEAQSPVVKDVGVLESHAPEGVNAEGSAPYREFAHRTAVLVKAHLGWLDTL